MAKALLQEQAVKVNGEIEERRGRKLYAGDLVAVDGKADSGRRSEIEERTPAASSRGERQGRM